MNPKAKEKVPGGGDEGEGAGGGAQEARPRRDNRMDRDRGTRRRGELSQGEAVAAFTLMHSW